MEYPKVITLQDEKMKKFLTEKSLLVTTGRGISEEIEKLEAEMQEIDNQMKEIEKTVDISEFVEREKEISAKVDVAIQEMDQVQKEIRDKMIATIPPELGARYEEIKTKKEQLENDRNKVALKVQKYNDKIIPFGRKLMKPHLEDNFDDYETIGLEDGEIKAVIFNHVEDFKTAYNKRKK